jgi:predicted house-cleaning noncanonical NTP pyrophosphatase (MazG superfamily)
MSDDKFVSTSGATSSKLKARYDLIPRSAIEALAIRLALGAEKHGERNYERGDSEYCEERINHLLSHVHDFVEHRKLEDLQAAITNCAMLCFFFEKGLVKTREQLNQERGKILER